MQIRLFAAATAAVLALAAPAAAQDDPVRTVVADTTPAPLNGLEKGAWSLSFAVFGGERLELAVWEMVGPRTNLGLSLEVAANGRDRHVDGTEDIDEATTSIGLGVNVRQYLSTSRRVAPFLHGRVFGRGSYSRRGIADVEDVTRGRTAGLEAAVGAEWFPVRQFSVSGYTGARFAVSRFDQDQDAPDGQDHEIVYNEGGFQTFTSALSVQIYF